MVKHHLILITLLVASAWPSAVLAEPYVFWADYNSGTIKRILGDGSSATTIVSGYPNPFCVEVDSVNNKIYWASGNNLAIRRSNLDGSSIEDIVTGLGNIGVYSLALDTTNNYVYWANANGGTLNRIHFDGSGGIQQLVTGLAAATGLAIDVSGGKIYYGELVNGRISRANLDGSGAELLYTGAGFSLRGLAINPAAGNLYVATASGTVLRSNLDGSSLTTIISSGLSGAFGIEVDLVAQKLYITDSASSGAILRSNLDGSSLETIATSAGNVFDVGVNGNVAPPTPTSTPSSTPTITPTPTQTPTSMPTHTPTPTPTATSTSTYTATFTPTLTPTPTDTPTSTPTATFTATVTPDNTPTPTATVGTNQLAGRILNPELTPIPNVVVYLFGQNANDSLLEVGALAGEEFGSRSTLTDSSGQYLFSGLPAGSYRIQPDLTGFNFVPAEVSLDNGNMAPNIAAVAIDLNDAGCIRTDVTTKIVESDARSRRLLNFGIKLARRYEKRAGGLFKEGSQLSLVNRLARSSLSLQRAYTSILDRSLKLPKVVLDCSGKVGCSERNYRIIRRRYQQQIDTLNKVTNVILAISNGKVTFEPAVSRNRKFASAIRRLAIRAARDMPGRSDICS